MSNNIQSVPQSKDAEESDEEIPLGKNQPNKETSVQEFSRQNKMAQQCCDLGRKLISEQKYEEAAKEFSKSVMTFEYILKSNLQQRTLQAQIRDMLRDIVIPAYSNLSLSHLKLGRYELALTCATQVLNHDPANVKNLYRKAVSQKMLKEYDNAIQDFEKVGRLDETMKRDSQREIIQCKRLKKEAREKEKKTAKRLIEGYANDIPQSIPQPQEEIKQSSAGSKSLLQRARKCVEEACLWCLSLLRRRA